METIYVAVAIDSSYVQHAGVMLCSLFENNPDSQFFIYLFQNSIEESLLTLLKSLVKKYHQSIEIIDISSDSIKHFKVSGHITVASYFRLFIPAFVGAHIDKILYLDADITVNNNIKPLWNIDVSDYYLGAIENVTPDKKVILQNVEEYRYFNAGVLLINLEKWRKNQIMQQTFQFIEQNPDKIVFHDQDVLNATLYGKWLPLHPKYNMQGALFMEEFDSFRGDPVELQEAIQNPVIIHYSTPLKPWQYLSFNPYTQEYFKYLAHTPWKDYQPTDKNLVRIVRKAVRPYLRKIGIRKVFGKCLY